MSSSPIRVPVAKWPSYLGYGALAFIVFMHFRNASANNRFTGDAHPYATYLKHRS